MTYVLSQPWLVISGQTRRFNFTLADLNVSVQLTFGWGTVRKLNFNYIRIEVLNS